MLFINLSFLFLFLAGVFCCLKKSGDWIKTIDKKEHRLYLLYPLADWILHKTRLDKILDKKNDIGSSLRALYAAGKPEIIYKTFWCRRISMLLTVLIIFNLMSLISFIAKDGRSLLVDGKYVERPGYGEGSSQAELKVIVESNTEESNKADSNTAESNTSDNNLADGKTVDSNTADCNAADSNAADNNAADNNAADNKESGKVLGPFNLTIKINEKGYTQEELDLIFTKSIEYLKKEVLGENKSADSIYYKLNFIKTIPGTSIKVDWYPEDYGLIQADGSVVNANINPEGVQTTVTVGLSYGKQQRKQSLIFRIMPEQLAENEILAGKLEKEIDAASENTSTDRYLKLPDTLEGYHLIWNENKKDSRPTLFFLGIILSAVIWLFGDKELDNRMKARKEQMLIDYPEIINKFTLLINAGMTIKQAWMKITEDYGVTASKSSTKKRYAYEEMLVTAHELNLGSSEYSTYVQFGRRTGLIPYIKFSSFITQNLKKGTRGFTDLLMQEAVQAFEERKGIAKRRGEEAGTKLLIPMMVMLIIVFLIIMIPAFLSFQLA